ncbi:PA14 domain-containing protein, partial [Spirosoma flavum]
GLKAGVHAMRVDYFQSGGGQALSVSYSGPNLSKQLIPDASLKRVDVSVITTNSGTGLRADYFNNTTLTAPAQLTRTDATVDFDWGYDSPAPGTINTDGFSARWLGQVEAPTTGTYTFSTSSDDGVRLWVNGTLVVDNWTDHGPTTNDGTPLTLTAGQRYNIRMEYYENGYGAVARLLWSYPGQSQQIIPKTRLYPSSTSSQRIGAISKEESADPFLTQIYPVPARGHIWIRYYAEKAGEALVQLINSAAQPVLQVPSQLVSGENLIKVAVDQLSQGSYILTLTQGQQRLSRKVLIIP